MTDHLYDPPPGASGTGFAWDLLEQPLLRGVLRWLADLNRLYRERPALLQGDSAPSGFEWVDVSDALNSVLALLRFGEDRGNPVLAVFNLTPVVRENYRVGAPGGGRWRELLDSDAAECGGSRSPRSTEEPELKAVEVADPARHNYNRSYRDSRWTHSS